MHHFRDPKNAKVIEDRELVLHCKPIQSYRDQTLEGHGRTALSSHHAVGENVDLSRTMNLTIAEVTSLE